MQKLNHVELEGEELEDTNTFEVKWISPTLKYGVVRKSDRKQVHQGSLTKESAIEWLRVNRKALGA